MVKSIYLAKIYFTDLKDYKIRPILVIKEIENDCICLPLTTNLAQKGIVLTNNDLTEGILRKDFCALICLQHSSPPHERNYLCQNVTRPT